ncbi:hypothetical protein SEA_GALACTICA_61 [Streptomyces phage Galactica]|nr:hypothetical protein SEA_GALACTICA_61 [Streptomyces phage Galactica]
MTNPAPMPSAPPRSQAQRIGDLARERDRVANELIQVKRLLGMVRDAAFNPAWDRDQSISAIRQALVDGWENATPPGRAFDLMRAHDSSKISGEGRVAEGFEFENGKVALCWLGKFSSVNVYDSIDHVRAIHGHGGSTEVKFR